MLISRLFLSFCSLINVSQSTNFYKPPLKLTHPVFLQLSDFFVKAFSLGSQVCLVIQVPGDCKLFVWKSVNCIYRKKKSKCKQFADDASLFSVVNDINTSASDFNEDFGFNEDFALMITVLFNEKWTLTQTLKNNLMKLYLAERKLPDCT